MKLPVINPHAKETEVIWVDIQQEMLLMTIESGHLIIRTSDGGYHLPVSLDDWAVILRECGYEKSDRNCIVNLARVVGHDESNRLLMFDGEQAGDKRVTATVSGARWSKLKRILKQVKD